MSLIRAVLIAAPDWEPQCASTVHYDENHRVQPYWYSSSESYSGPAYPPRPRRYFDRLGEAGLKNPPASQLKCLLY
ncbi:hypothetical protein AG1IA_08568 [Rhizoctonia solani AG-1 IA]|uniref:Uncharacterized protein n=1 Tax=Thanatephorus cucumeris (strain AG1-IA) TaxID=983506 RepID=L8WGU9_THACA|nr:hypothetical protein AG1IA_08568 [Rhizoctonia solani AG-1 IA]